VSESNIKWPVRDVFRSDSVTHRRTHIHMNTHACAYIHTHTRNSFTLNTVAQSTTHYTNQVHTYLHTHTHIPTHTHTLIHTHTHSYTHTLVHTHIHHPLIHTHSFIHTPHIHMHSQAQTPKYRTTPTTVGDLSVEHHTHGYGQQTLDRESRDKVSDLVL
jgi:hypothetical protein